MKSGWLSMSLLGESKKGPNSPMTNSDSAQPEHTRRNFLSLAGKGLGLAALSSATVASLLKEIQAATKSVAHLTPQQAAMDEDYWSVIQNAFSVTRGIINLNNGGVSPSPRIVTEALVRYIWQQEDATAYTMWQLLEPQSETIRTGLAEVFGCDREEIAITRNASESLEILLMGMDFKSGDEILTTTQDYPRMLTTLRQREKREGLVLKLIKIPIPPKNLSEITAAFERGITNRTRLILIMHQVNVTGQITPVKAVCEMARARGIETIVDGAHSFAQFQFPTKRSRLRLLWHQLAQMAVCAQGHRDALCQTRQDREDLAVDGGRVETGERHSQV